MGGRHQRHFVGGAANLNKRQIEKKRERERRQDATDAADATGVKSRNVLHWFQTGPFRRPAFIFPGPVDALHVASPNFKLTR